MKTTLFYSFMMQCVINSGWSLACAKLLSAAHGGMVIGIDLLPFREIDNVAQIEGQSARLITFTLLKIRQHSNVVTFITRVGDFRALATREEMTRLTKGRAADVVISGTHKSANVTIVALMYIRFRANV